MSESHKVDCYEDSIEKRVEERHNRALSIVTHDLKSPLSAIIGFCRHLSKIIEDDSLHPEWVAILHRMRDAGQDMFTLIEDINVMTKLAAGNEKLEPVWIENLAEKIEQIKSTFEHQTKARKITFTVKVASPMPAVRWDYFRLRNHVLNNVVSNAMKFTPHGGKVELCVTTLPGFVVIKISDTGPGIPQSEEDRIFCRYGQIESNLERTYSGAGLGLYNARLFVERHRGDIRLDSSCNTGATFLVKLPVDVLA